MAQEIPNNSQVRIEGSDTIYTVKQYLSGANKYQIQLGNDGTAIQWVESAKLIPVEQPAPATTDEISQMVPPKSIMH
jgi:hypothetical protein